jgi:uncharacterized protein (DUF885 family)
MRRWVRRSVSLAAALLLALGIFLVPTLFGKPWSIDHYFLRVLASFALEHPMLLSYARVLEPYGIDFHADELEDFSVAMELRIHEQARDALAGLRRYDPDELDDAQRLSADVLAWFLEAELQKEPFLFHGYPVAQFDGLHTLLPDFMLNIHQIRSARDARNYVARLAAFGVALDGIAERVRVRAERGIVPPRFVLAASRRQIAELAAPAADAHPLVTHLRDALAALPEAPAAEAQALVADATARLGDTIVPGYARLDATLAELETTATDDAGVWKLPDGDAYYRWALRFHTTTAISPDAVHALGLAEVSRIEAAVRETLAEAGVSVPDAASFEAGAALRALGEDARFRYPDTEEGRAEILADYRAILGDARARLPALFGRLPRADVVVERVPAFKEAGSAGAYYHPPAFDGSRPGVFYANLRAPGEVARFGMRTLTYHEAIPGHHLQIALSFENRGMPFFRRVIPFTAFVEGWALYAERLAAEQGFHPTPFDRIGQLQAELFRSVRLVVDTGIHAKRWTREEAIEWMLRHTGMGRTEVTAEIERYIVLPGQACAYKIGQLELLALRDRARSALGERFDLRAFHDHVLSNGSLPLELLRPLVERWIAEQSR